MHPSNVSHKNETDVKMMFDEMLRIIGLRTDKWFFFFLVHSNFDSHSIALL